MGGGGGYPGGGGGGGGGSPPRGPPGGIPGGVLGGQPLGGGGNPPGNERLLGTAPEIFNGSRKDLHCFIQSFSLYWEMNADHPAMANPYKCTLICLGLIQGPDVDHWKDSYFGTLSDKVRAWCANPADPDGQDPNNEQ